MAGIATRRKKTRFCGLMTATDTWPERNRCSLAYWLTEFLWRSKGRGFILPIRRESFDIVRSQICVEIIGWSRAGVDGSGTLDDLNEAILLGYLLGRLLMETLMNRTRISALSMAFAMGLAIFSGCESDRMSNIPANATIASSGDDRLSYTAATDGTIWVYDVDADQIDYSGPIAVNESVTVDPHINSIKINDRVVSDKLNKGAKHRIYFVPAAGMSTP
jgi:hypothetical protein